MSNQKSIEYGRAMKALAHIARKHQLTPSDRERKLFWQGVLHGLSRRQEYRDEPSEDRSGQPSRPRRKTPLDASRVNDSHVDSAVGLPKRTPDLNQGGVFQL